MADSDVATGTDPGKPSAARTALEAVVAMVLAGAGAAYLLDDTTKHEPWVGFGLIGLGVLVFLMRGRVISGFEAGPGGLKFTLQQAIAEAREAKGEARAAKDEAESAKQIASQQITPAGKNAEVPPAIMMASGPRRIVVDGDDWAHPGLKPGDPPDNDPQKGQWGGEDTRNGRRLSAAVKGVGDELFEVVLTVSPVGAAPPIEGDVRFHLHDTFPRAVRTVKARDGRAKLSVIAWGAFTAGAEVRGEPETYLELDLADPKYGYPEKFRER